MEKNILDLVNFVMKVEKVNYGKTFMKPSQYTTVAKKMGKKDYY